MKHFGKRGVASLLTLIAYATPSISGQNPAYHLELFGTAAGGSARDMVIVNDSDKPIEAYVASCPDHLENPQELILHFQFQDWGLVGKKGEYSVADSLPSGGTALMPLVPGWQDCEWQIDAVIFGDGSYEGDTRWVKTLKSYSDGLSARTSNWAKRLNQIPVSESSLEKIHTEAERLYAEDDDTLLYLHGPHLEHPEYHYWFVTQLREYWLAQRAIDGNVRGLSRSDSEQKADLADMVFAFKRKVDNDLALKRLNVVFPPLHPSPERRP